MTKQTKLLVLMGFQLFGLKATYAQQVQTDAGNAAFGKVETFFLGAVKQQSLLYNGKVYQTYGSKVDGYATFQDLGLVNGEVTYNNVRYSNVPLQYDLYIDKVVSVLYDQRSMFSLNSEQVKDFYIKNHHFVYLNVDSSSLASDIKTGFFEVIHDGEIKIFAKRIKKLQFTTNKDVPYYFNPKTSYFLWKDHKYYEFSGESGLLNLFKDKKKELRQQLSANKISYKNNPEQAMALMASYYESLTR